MAAKPKTSATSKPRRRKAPPAKGIPVAEVAAAPAKEARETAEAVEAAGGRVLASYRDPLGGHAVLFCALPIDQVEPTPYQRDVSDAHVKRLEKALRTLDRFLDPVIAVRAPTGGFWTPNGNHRLNAMRAIGATVITALVLPEAETAYQILALNTEKAHALREKSLEVIRMAHALAGDPRKEADFELQFEEPLFLTLGACYQENGRFPGGAYQPVLRRIDEFLPRPMAKALDERARRAKRVADLEAKVAEVVAALKARGLTSPYLRAFVVARINPLRWGKREKAPFDGTLDEMEKRLARFDAGKITPGDLARTGGAPDAAEE
ncbi:MAG TPA: ParB N-terminal domain-containing protein [Planctomycetota bacterium]|nr:ParB N-terminal domain-containing protein [Planctomycetota bacterium]